MATTSNGPLWDDHEQDGRAFSLSHLLPTFIDCVVPALPPKKNKPGRAEIAVKLRVHYSHHCFTHALDKFPNPSTDHYYTCARRKETRVFCIERWTESHALPAIVATLRNCYFTRHHNYFVIRNPSNPALGDYFVFFTVSINRQGGFVEMAVESAYPRTDGERLKRAEKVSFNVLVVNALRGIRTHARGPTS